MASPCASQSVCLYGRGACSWCDVCIGCPELSKLTGASTVVPTPQLRRRGLFIPMLVCAACSIIRTFRRYVRLEIRADVRKPCTVRHGTGLNAPTCNAIQSMVIQVQLFRCLA